jgi:hypothetical protein
MDKVNYLLDLVCRMDKRKWWQDQNSPVQFEAKARRLVTFPIRPTRCCQCEFRNYGYSSILVGSCGSGRVERSSGGPPQPRNFDLAHKTRQVYLVQSKTLVRTPKRSKCQCCDCINWRKVETILPVAFQQADPVQVRVMEKNGLRTLFCFLTSRFDTKATAWTGR